MLFCIREKRLQSQPLVNKKIKGSAIPVLPIIVFGASLFASVLWLAGSAVYIESRVGWENLVTMNPSDIAFFMTAVLLPVVVLWIIMGFVHYAGVIHKQGAFLGAMLTQLKRSSEQNEIILKNLISSQAQSKNNDILKYIDIAIADLNNTLAEIAVRFGIMRKTSEDSLWHRVGEGDRWAFCQIILENAEETEDFDNALKKRMTRDLKLAEAVKAFCSRFEKIIHMLSSNDINRPFIDIIENGDLGTVYTRLSRLASYAEVSPVVTEPESEPEPTLEEEAGVSHFRNALFNMDTEEAPVPENEPLDFSPVFDEEEIVTIEITNNRLEENKEPIDSDWEARKKEIMAKYAKDKEEKSDFSAPAFLKKQDWNS